MLEEINMKKRLVKLIGGAMAIAVACSRKAI